MLAGAAWHLLAAATYAPDRVDPWMVSPLPIFLGVAGVDIAGAALVAWGLRQWARTGRRGPVAVGDFTGTVLVLIVPLLPPILLVAIGVLAVMAGGCVAAAPVRRSNRQPTVDAS